jgi:hypothetical protein
MSKILKVNEGDYRVKVPSGNSVILDTGTLTGSVVITGNLDVQGQTTTIESINTTVKDNILVLNNGDTGTNGISPHTVNGVTSKTSGIEIDRGSVNSQVASASFLFNEEVPHYNTLSTSYDNGTFVLSTKSNTISSVASLQLSGIEVTSISNNNVVDIQFNLHNSDTYLSLVNSTYNTSTYEDRLIAGNSDANHKTNNSITTKKYVNTYVVSGVVTAGMADVDKIYKATSGVEKSKILASTTDLTFSINTTQRAVIDATGLTVDTINLFGNTIKNTGTNQLVLQSVDTNLVEINSVLSLTNQSATISASSLKNKLYSKAADGPGRTGIYFTNTNQYAGADHSDELVSRHRAVLLSMLF